MKTTLARLLVLALLTSLAACDKPKPSSGQSSAPKSSDAATASSPAATSARQTSFAEVTSQLDPGGNVFVYFSTDQWLAGLTTNISELRDFALQMPLPDPENRKWVERGSDLLINAVKGSGVQSLTGVGISSIQLTPELYRTKLFLHHPAGQGDGLMWNVMGRRPHAVTGLDLLSTNTAFAMYGDLELKTVWQALEQGLTHSGVPEIEEAVKKWPELFEQQSQVSWSKLLDSFGGEAGIVLTLNPGRKLIIPVDDQNLSMPTPGLLLLVKVNDDLIYNRVSSELKKNPDVQETTEKGLKLCVMPLPMPLPIDVQITVASLDGYFVVASSPNLVRDLMAVRAGAQPALRKSADVEPLLKYLPAEGNQFVYLAPQLAATFTDVQRQVAQAKGLGGDEFKFFEKLFVSQQPAFGLSIGSHTATGWQSTSIGNRNASAAILAAPAVPVVALTAAMVLPAMSNAKERAQSISCVNNLKQVGLAFKMWQLDHENKYPFQVSTNKSGTLELCERDAAGYDVNSFQHFLVLSQELGTPRILVCPEDPLHQAVAEFTGLTAENVSYQVRSGPEVDDTHPDEILAYCPVHGHVLHVDGAVIQGKKDQPPK